MSQKSHCFMCGDGRVFVPLPPPKIAADAQFEVFTLTTFLILSDQCDGVENTAFRNNYPQSLYGIILAFFVLFGTNIVATGIVDSGSDTNQQE